jgi:hypothetical protein
MFWRTSVLSKRPAAEGGRYSPSSGTGDFIPSSVRVFNTLARQASLAAAILTKTYSIHPSTCIPRASFHDALAVICR